MAAAMLLVADLLVLPWHHYFVHVDTANLGIQLPSFSYNRTGVQSPNASLGIVAVAVAAVMAVQVVVVRLTRPTPRMVQVHLVLGPAVFGLLIAKTLGDNNFLGVGAWLGLLFGAALALGGVLVGQDAPAEPEGVVPFS